MHRIINLTHNSCFFVCRKIICAWNSIYASHLDIFAKLFSNTPISHVFVFNPNCNSVLKLQMVMYLKLMAVWGQENNGQVFLWSVSNIKVSVIASFVMKKCLTDVFMSVFWDARKSMELRYDEEWQCNNAVSFYFLEILHFTLI